MPETGTSENDVKLDYTVRLNAELHQGSSWRIKWPAPSIQTRIPATANKYTLWYNLQCFQATDFSRGSNDRAMQYCCCPTQNSNKKFFKYSHNGILNTCKLQHRIYGETIHAWRLPNLPLHHRHCNFFTRHSVFFTHTRLCDGIWQP